MLFDLIFLSIFVVAWLICGFAPWLVLSIATRGEAGLINLPLCLFAAVVAGFAVPVFGANGVAGLWISLLAAVAVPSILLALRRFSLHHPASTPTASQEHTTK